MAAADYLRGLPCRWRHDAPGEVRRRDVALDALMQVDKANAWSDEALRRLIAQNRLDSRDAAFATRLCYGVMQNRMLLDYYIGCWCARSRSGWSR